MKNSKTIPCFDEKWLRKEISQTWGEYGAHVEVYDMVLKKSSKKFNWERLLLSPLIFIYALFLLAAGTLFPIPALMIYSFWGLLFNPFIWLLRKTGSDVKNIDPFIQIGNDTLGHLAGLTIYIWGAFAIVYKYIKDGSIFNVN